MKRAISLLLMVCMLCASCIGQAASYVDVQQDAWYSVAISTVSDNQLMNGTAENIFAPNDEITRGMFVTVLGRYLNADTTGDAGFSDVSADAYYAPYIAWANKNGIAGGVGEGRFAPDENITREQMAVMLLGMYRYQNDGPQGDWMIRIDYKDVNEISDWAFDAVAFCKIKGSLVGADGKFRPKAQVTRAEAAQVVARLFDAHNARLFQAAIADARIIEEDEICPVTAITRESDMVTWDSDDKRVMLLTFHRYPDSYVAGESVNLQWGEVWTFTDREIQTWYDQNKDGVKNWDLRFKQLIGVDSQKAYTHVTAFWVDPEDVVRPAYVYDITKSEMKSDFEATPTEDFLAWFEEQMAGYDSEYAAPWTRLGYTYDWADNGTEFGLSEFIIRKDADVEVVFTDTVDAFVGRLENHFMAEQGEAAA